MKQLAAIASSFLLANCGQAQLPFRQVQFCLKSISDIARLKSVVSDIARSGNLKFTDRSADAQAEAENIAKTEPNMKVAHPMIVLSVDRSDGFGFGGTNFPEAPLQIGFGFTSGKSEVEARKFAANVVGRLSQYWVVHEVPTSQGEFPLKKCDYVTRSA